MDRFEILVFGVFSLRSPDGRDVSPKGRKAKALIAALATAPDGRRARKWLQSLLWSDRGEDQGAASLRQCIYEIRRTLGEDRELVHADAETIWLDLDRAWVAPAEAEGEPREFLEGIDIRDPAFEEWLREQRSAARARSAPAVAETSRPQATRAEAPAEAAANIEASTGHDWSLSISVLPLRDAVGDADGRFIGEGLSEDLIDGLQRLRWLPVIARSSSFSGQGTARYEGPELARSLGSAFVVDGSVSMRRGRRIARFRLCSTLDGASLWSDVYQVAELTDDAGLEDAMTRMIGAIGRSAEIEAQRQAMNRPPHVLGYLEHVWRARWHLAQLTRKDAQAARAHLDEALNLQPNGTEALIQLGFWHLWRVWVQRGDADDLHTADRLARRASALDPDDGRPYAQMGIARAWRRDHDMAQALLRRAVELNPSLAIAHHQIGSTHCLADRPEDALQPILTALTYSPRDQLDFTFQLELAVALARTGRFAEAYDRATRSLMHKPRYWYGHLVRIRAAAGLEDDALEAEARDTLRATGLKITPEHLDWLPFRSDDWLGQLRAVID